MGRGTCLIISTHVPRPTFHAYLQIHIRGIRTTLIKRAKDSALKKSLDVLILFALVISRIRIDTLADIAAFPERHDDVRQLVGSWWPAWSLDLLAHPVTDPVSMMLIVTALGLLIIYLGVDIFSADPQARHPHRIKLILLYSIIILLVVGKTVLLINLRQIRGPASYSHDGGTIQTEVTIDYFLQGLNPYVADYVDTPMAAWGFSEYRTALYHYPYLPWTFILATPFQLASQTTVGWFDQRLVYLLLFAITLILVQKLVRHPQAQLIALTVIGLNPIGSVSLIFGENDPYVFAWIVMALWFVRPTDNTVDKRRTLIGSACYGLACASKPTAWFLAPFWLLYLLRDQWGDSLIPPVDTWQNHIITLLKRAWPLPTVALLIIGPWFVWNPEAMYDDVWRWSAGLGEHGYQIWGWGASNYVLGLGLVSDRFEYWPFIIPGFIITAPLLFFLLHKQAKVNTLPFMLYAYAVLLAAFFFTSRFLQPNYLGYILGFLALAMTMEETGSEFSVQSSEFNDKTLNSEL